MDSLLAIPTAELAVKSLIFAALFLVLLHVLKGRGSGSRQIVCLAGSVLLFLLPLGHLLPRYEAEALGSILPAITESEADTPRSTSPGASPGLLSLIWMTGTAFLVLRLGLGLIALRHRQLRGLHLAEELANRCARRIGLKNTPEVVISSSVHSPSVAGALNPTIFLPVEAADWPEERLQLVLLHEMAHIKRADLWTQLPGLLACALYWFNPLVWMLHRSLCREREFACDSLVVRSGANPQEYAEHLVDIAASRLHPAVAIPMAGDPSQLENRVVQLLSEGGPRRGSLLPAGVLLMTLFFSAILALGAGSITSVKSREPRASGVVQTGAKQTSRPAGTAFQPGNRKGAWTQDEIEKRLRANPFPSERP